MNHTQLIQGYIDLTGAKSYLEIGLGDCRNFDAIRCENKWGCDPNAKLAQYEGIWDVTSDVFFALCNNYTPEARYDVIFIDGLHEYTQVLRDIENAMKYLSPNGLILLHDTNPPDEKTALPLDKLEKYPPDGIAWCGDVWKAVYILYARGAELHTHPDDYGLTVIRKYEMPTLSGIVNDLAFDSRRKTYLNLLPPNTPAVMP